MNWKITILAIATIFPTAAGDEPGKLPAFPTAEGFGASSIGGRGGQVVFVTNLNDNGPGSLRAACELEIPRVVIFRVSGTIALESPIELEKKNSFVTIAGQSAPGDGICVRKNFFRLKNGFHDGVFRHLRIRMGEDTPRPGVGDCLKINDDCQRIMIDHCSLSWSTDEILKFMGEFGDITFQWCFFSSPLSAKSIGGNPPYGPLISGGAEGSLGDISIHHCLFAHSDNRNPSITKGRVSLVNNVHYNSSSFDVGIKYKHQLELEADVVNCYFQEGPLQKSARYKGVVLFKNVEDARPPGLFLSGNRMVDREGNPAEDFDPQEPFSLVKKRVSKGVALPNPEFRAREKRLAAGDFPVTIHSADEARMLVLAKGGASQPRRDPVDVALVADLENSTGKIGSRLDYPELKTFGAAVDTDEDGIPDDWEKAHGLDPKNGADANEEDASGYRFVEIYLNELAKKSELRKLTLP